MASTSKSARSRRGPSAKQLHAMLDFFVMYPGLTDGRYLKFYGKSNHDKKWMELAGKVNMIGRAHKSAYQWQSVSTNNCGITKNCDSIHLFTEFLAMKAVWGRIKKRTCIRFHARKNSPNVPPITDLESRVIAILGNKYMEEHRSLAKNVIRNEEFDTDLEDAVSIDSTEFPPLNKMKRVEDERDIHAKFLEIAQKQADALKIISECGLASVKAAKSMVAATNLMSKATNSMTVSIKAMEGQLKACAEVFKNLTNSKLGIEHIKTEDTEVDEFVLSK